MNFISYSQNFEDVVLWRALKHVEYGFYVDIGAWSPDLDSVTRAFYERGWHGINIEPNPEFYAQLQVKRPNDTNLCIAISDKPGSLAMNFLSNPGLSTLDESIANMHKDAGWEVDKQQVEVKTLTSVWENHVPPDQEVHFLKVDVEGLEEAVLRGGDWIHCRPWIVILESTLPMSQEESHASWEDLLLSTDYKFAYADGLNRFYVAQEHAELLPAFKFPPNVFDEFLLHAQQLVEERANWAEERAALAETELQSVFVSRSWRITAPMRWFGHQLRLLREQGLVVRLKALVKKIAGPISWNGIAVVGVRSRVRLRCVALVKKLGLYHRLLPLYWRLSGRDKVPRELQKAPFSLGSNRDLSPQAQQIYADLKAALAKRKHESG